jgi:DNA-binding IclR family transcriptional regulator
MLFCSVAPRLLIVCGPYLWQAMAMNPKSEPKSLEGVAAAQRALSVLTCFRQGDDQLTLAEMARRTGIVKTTVMRLLISLEQAGLIVRVNGSYQLGGEIVRLHSIYSSSHGLEKVILPVLQELAEETKETAAFYTEHQGQRFCLFRADSPLALRLHITPGTYRPLDNASSAQILKLFRAWPDEQPALPSLPVYTAGATDPHTASVSAPVLGQGQHLVGALSITGPISRLTWENATRVQDILMQAASKISRSLGGELPVGWREAGS